MEKFARLRLTFAQTPPARCPQPDPFSASRSDESPLKNKQTSPDPQLPAASKAVMRADTHVCAAHARGSPGSQGMCWSPAISISPPKSPGSQGRCAFCDEPVSGGLLRCCFPRQSPRHWPQKYALQPIPIRLPQVRNGYAKGSPGSPWKMALGSIFLPAQPMRR